METVLLTKNKGNPPSGLGIGRRKEAVAIVHLIPGSGKFLINGLPPILYFGQNPFFLSLIRAPLKTLKTDFPGTIETFLKMDVIIKTKGGGLLGQADAIRLGLAKAILDFQHKQNSAEFRLLTFHSSFREKGYLTSDSRIKERRKYGLRKARKAPQYHKR
uniref:ribosomal protein S9 n=1 Tax=Hydrocytium acuminatum TaxID=1745963 RepID=UPI002A828569|nr:ribosomal protein S9 [Hydrocytium acuminatum]WOR09542.1 ribosomal protein S9 [Hydrocytium acuminatum]